MTAWLHFPGPAGAVWVAAGALSAINVLAYALFAWDKRQARRHGRRVRERTLLLVAAAGGAAGAWAGMRQWRHKTRHLRFRLLVPLLLALQTALAGAWLWLMFAR